MNEREHIKACPLCGGGIRHGLFPHNKEKVTCADDSCPMSGLLLKVEQWNTRAAPAPSVSEIVREIDETFDAIYSHDRTPAYEYGEALRNGSTPGPGKRFLTPRELVGVYRMSGRAKIERALRAALSTRTAGETPQPTAP